MRQGQLASRQCILDSAEELVYPLLEQVVWPVSPVEPKTSSDPRHAQQLGKLGGPKARQSKRLKLLREVRAITLH